MTENTQIQGRFWHLAVERLTTNFISAKRRSLHKVLAQIPKILRCLIPKSRIAIAIKQLNVLPVT